MKEKKGGEVNTPFVNNMRLSQASRERAIIKAHNAGYRAPDYSSRSHNHSTGQYELWGVTEDRRVVYSTEHKKEDVVFDVEEALQDSESTDQFQLAFERERSLSHIED